MNPSPTHCRNWVIIVPIAAITAAYIYFVFLPNRRAVAELRDQIKTKQDLVAQAEGTRTALGQAKADLARAQKHLADCRGRVTEEKNLGAFFGKIHELANTAKVRVGRFDPQQPQLYEQLRRVPCSVGCTGSFAQIYEFLRSLESLPAMGWVTSLRLEKAAKDGEAGRVAHCDVVLAIFTDHSKNSGYARRSD